MDFPSGIKKYLDKASNQLNTQLEFENTVLPTSTVSKFNTNSYQNGKLKYSFSGDKIIYYNDNHFEATGNLVYKSFDNSTQPTVTIKSEKATGQIESAEVESSEQSALPMGTNSRIQSAHLPDDVYFDFNGNKGKASNVFIDMEKETVQSANAFDSSGPQGDLKGKGFYYSIKDEMFKIKSNVDGNFNIKNSSQKKD